MKRLALFLLFLTSAATGAVDFPRAVGKVNDFAGVLGAGVVRQLDAIAEEVDAKTGAEIAVVTTPSLAGETVETYATGLFKAWGIGKKGKDNGVMLLIAPRERQLRIEVGYGLEGVLPDGKCGEIRDRCLVPAFRRGEYGAGALCAAAEMARAILGGEPASAAGAPRPSPPQPARHGSPPALVALVFLVVLVQAVMRAGITGRRGRYLPGGFWLGGGGFGGGGFGGGGFGGFGGGGSGGGGASGGW